MRLGTILSAAAHVGLIAWGVVSLASSRQLDASKIEAIPVALVKIDAVTAAPKAAPAPAPLPKPAPVAAAPAKPQPPAPTPPAPTLARAEPQSLPPTAPPAATPKPIAEPAPTTVAAAAPIAPPKPRIAPAPPAPAPAAKPAAAADEPFDIDKITAVLDRPRPAPAPQPDGLALGSLIAASAIDTHMTLSEVDALRARIAPCWTPPPGWVDPSEVRVVMIIALNADGSIAAAPEVVQAPAGRYQQTAPESAVRAVRACAPYVLPPEKYQDWKRSEDNLRSPGDGDRMMRRQTMVTGNRFARAARRAALALAAFAAVALSSVPASALIEIDINRGNVQPLPIALPAFAGTGSDAQLGIDIATVIGADLGRSGLFLPVAQASVAQRPINPDTRPQFADWSALNAQALVVGRVTRQSDGRLRADFRLWDVLSGQQMAGQQFYTTPDNWRQIAHIIADAIYERLTGEKGYFDTRVVFVDETGPKDKRIKRLAIMDQDGANIRYLTKGTELVLTPRFNPTAQEITYMSYGGQPRVYLFNVETGQRESVGDFPNMTFAPRFSPDGQRVIMSLQQGVNANIFTLDLRSRRTTRLTDSASIDTSPSYSPDGAQIVFESDRGGSQQLYVMNADGSNPHRITFRPGTYSTPVWSPRGDLIAFTRQANGQFAIGVIRPDGSGERILTEGFHNEGPTWAPNGRALMFFRDTPGPNGGPQLWTIDLTGYNEFRIVTPAFASDPAWSPLIN